MFIIICQDVIEKAINRDDSDNNDAIEALKKVLLAVLWKKHVVFVPELSEEDIQKLEKELTSKEIKLLDYVFSKRLNSNSLMAKLSIYAQITFNESTHKDAQIIYINPKNISCFELHEETHFLVENILDSEFYDEVICNYYQRKNRLHTDYYTTAFYPVQGGGVTISEVIKYEMNLAQHFCLVIGDSDKKCADYKNEGDTAKGIRAVVKEYERDYGQMPFIDYYIMSKTREIENLIPICILNIFSNNKQKDFLKKYNNLLAFFDMKIGMDYKLLYYDKIRSGWKKVFPDIIDWEQIDNFKATSHNKDEFEEKVNALPKLVDEWGKTLLNKVLHPSVKKHIDAIHKLYDINESDLTPNQKEEWDEIGKLVFSWCCCFANPPR